MTDFVQHVTTDKIQEWRDYVLDKRNQGFKVVYEDSTSIYRDVILKKG